MSPIFCTWDMPVSTKGSLVQEHIANNNMSTKPRMLLRDGKGAKRIFLLTLLLKWYLDHGLQLTEVSQVVELQNAENAEL